jgi:hypothetical protein
MRQHGTRRKDKLRASKITLAAYDHVETITASADGYHGTAPWWYGWAIREAFIAGAQYADSANAVPPLAVRDSEKSANNKKG